MRNKERKINHKIINKKFAENPRKVYRDLTEEKIEITKPPDRDELEGFWRTLFENQKQHEENEWTNIVTEKNSEKNTMPELIITSEAMLEKIQHYGNFKAPGIDKLPNFWLKKFKSLHPLYLTSFNKMVNDEEEPPSWLTHGRTSLLPKSKETDKPNKYRPICCLTTTYKWLTGILADAIYEHLETEELLEEEQKGCIKSKMGTKDQLLINKTVLEDCKRRQRNLSMAWIDYRKAFDSVPHSWIIRCMELYKVSDNIRGFLGKQMAKWKTDITLQHENGSITLPDVKIQRGIYQGDSLSPLLFCMTIDPLSKMLKSKNIGYNLGKVRGERTEIELISHLLFMDDLKLYAENDEKLNELVQIVHNFSKDICMEFGLDKCSKCTIRKGKKVEDLEDGTQN